MNKFVKNPMMCYNFLKITFCEGTMASIYMKDDAARRAEKGILYDFLAPDGSESREAAEIIHARNVEFCKNIKSCDDYLDMKLAVEALSGNTNTVILDDLGLPSIMVLLPKMNSADLSGGLESRTHPAFIVKGKEYETVAVGKYISSSRFGRAYSLPNKDPLTCLNFDDARYTCCLKGLGWGIIPFSLWGAIALWCKKNSTMPEGNTYYGQWGEDEKNCGSAATLTKLDGREVPAHTLTGSGPLTWYHNHKRDGIADLCGNVFEWCAGFRWCDGELQIIENADTMAPYTDMSYDSPLWRAILPDGTLVPPNTEGSLKLDYRNERWVVCQEITSHSEEKRCCPVREIGLDEGIEKMPQILIELGICPEREKTGAPYGNDVFWGPNKGREQFPCRGGNWYDHVYACGGVFRTSVFYGRDIVGGTIGSRLAYYDIKK